MGEVVHAGTFLLELLTPYCPVPPFYLSPILPPSYTARRTTSGSLLTRSVLSWRRRGQPLGSGAGVDWLRRDVWSRLGYDARARALSGFVLPVTLRVQCLWIGIRHESEGLPKIVGRRVCVCRAGRYQFCPFIFSVFFLPSAAACSLLKLI